MDDLLAGPGVTDAVTGITLTSPSLVPPTVNQQFKNVEQPVTLTIKNAVTSGTTPSTNPTWCTIAL